MADEQTSPSTETIADGDSGLNSESEKRNLMQEIASLLSVNGGKVSANVEEFWRQICLALQTAPHGTVPEIAKTVLTKLGEEWDDDFLEDDSSTPSLGAYETLLARVKAGIDHEEGTTEAEDDEDASGALAREQGQIFVANADLPIKTIAQFIDDKTYILNPDWQRGYVWKPRQRKRFIESIFLGLPIPPVLLFQDAKKKVYVIDGRQRLETIYRYHLGSKDKKQRFKTFDKKNPGWGEGEKLCELAGKYFDKLPENWQRHFETCLIPARIFTGLSRKTLYEVFQRYNTGAVKLQAPEIRKAIYQGAPLHDLMFRISGENGFELSDPQEKRVARTLYQVMKNRTARYGAYNFVGRCMAFARVVEDLSVAQAIRKLMDDNLTANPEPFRKEFLDAFEKVTTWYDYPLSVVDDKTNKTIYHEWIATIQMVSTVRMLEHLKVNRAAEDAIKQAITEKWPLFVEAVLKDKQNTGTHWGRQREWIRVLEDSCGIKAQPAVEPAAGAA